MLVLTHGSPGTPAVQQLFMALHGMGRGQRHCGGLVVLGDGFERLGPIAGLAFLPEGLAVLAAHEVDGAPGYLYAPLRGSWTVGGQVAHLRDGGSSPVAELDAAVKSLVARVRRGGVDPGNVQAVIAVSGPLSGVAQPERERAAGMVVTGVGDAEVADALRAATRHTSGGLPQSWTTADVRAVLEMLGYRAGDIEPDELVTEGFPYSPYVLRPTSIDDAPFSREERPTLPGGGRQLRAYSEPITQTAAEGSPPASATGPIPAVTPPVPAVGSLPSADPANPGDLLVAPEQVAENRGSSARWIVPLVLLIAVAIGAWFGGRALFGADDTAAGSSTTMATEDPSASGSASEKPTAPEPQEIGGFQFTQGAYEKTEDCATYAYGDIQALLQDSSCTAMERGLYLTEVDGKAVVITLAKISMPDAESAATLKSTADTDGTGNVNDLLRDGTVPEGYPDPDVLDNSEYASEVDGTDVRIVQAAYVDGAQTNAEVDAAADAALGLTLEN